MKLKVENKVMETDEAVSIYFKNNLLFNRIKYKAGQFLILKFNINGKEEKRAYSFSSCPFTDNFLRITVKKIKNGLISNHIFDTIEEGDKIEVEPPMGSFLVEPDAKNAHKYVLFGGGSGITPILSITKAILLKEPKSKILFFYANKNTSSIIFDSEIQNLSVRHPNQIKVNHIIESPLGMEEHFVQGMLRNEVVEEKMSDLGWSFEECKYYVCGPAGFLEKTREILRDNKINSDKLNTELFTIPVVKFSGEDLESEITIINQGNKNTLKAKGNKSILQSALSNNISIPYSCKSGMCSTCKCKCVEGEVSMTDGHFLSDEEVKQGYILSCISFPKTERVQIEF